MPRGPDYHVSHTFDVTDFAKMLAMTSTTKKSRHINTKDGSPTSYPPLRMGYKVSMSPPQNNSNKCDFSALESKVRERK